MIAAGIIQTYSGSSPSSSNFRQRMNLICHPEARLRQVADDTKTKNTVLGSEASSAERLVSNQYDHSAPLSCTCSKGSADFDLDYTFVQTPLELGGDPNSYPRHEDHVHMHVTQKESGEGDAEVTSMTGEKRGFALLRHVI